MGIPNCNVQKINQLLETVRLNLRHASNAIMDIEQELKNVQVQEVENKSADGKPWQDTLDEGS